MNLKAWRKSINHKLIKCPDIKGLIVKDCLASQWKSLMRVNLSES